MERIQIESSMGGIVGMFSGVLLVFEWGKNKFAEVRKLKLPAWLDCVRLGEYKHKLQLCVDSPNVPEGTVSTQKYRIILSFQQIITAPFLWHFNSSKFPYLLYKF